MDKVNFTKITQYRFFKFNFFTKTELYSELAGDAELQQIEIVVRPDYFKQEFDIKEKDNG